MNDAASYHRMNALILPLEVTNMGGDYIHEDEVCYICGSKPRKKTCADCGGVGLVLTCQHGTMPPPFTSIKSRNYCSDCAEDHIDSGAQMVADAVGSAVQMGVGLAMAGVVLEGMDGDGMFDF